jgi:hypothetical protein
MVKFLGQRSPCERFVYVHYTPLLRGKKGSIEDITPFSQHKNPRMSTKNPREHKNPRESTTVHVERQEQNEKEGGMVELL